MFWKVTLSSALIFFLQIKDICTINVTFFNLICIWNHVRSVSFSDGGSRDCSWHIIFRDRTTLAFCFLGCVGKFQAREANSWPRSVSSLCVLFVFFFFFLGRSAVGEDGGCVFDPLLFSLIWSRYFRLNLNSITWFWLTRCLANEKTKREPTRHLQKPEILKFVIQWIRWSLPSKNFCIVWSSHLWTLLLPV